MTRRLPLVAAISGALLFSVAPLAAYGGGGQGGGGHGAHGGLSGGHGGFGHGGGHMGWHGGRAGHWYGHSRFWYGHWLGYGWAPCWEWTTSGWTWVCY